MKSLLSCRNLSMGYDNDLVIKDLNFSVEENDYLSIIGENGSGKSTLIKGILGLLRPLKGKLELAVDVKKNEIGYLPQMTVQQKNFPASVYEIVLTGCLNKRNRLPLYSQDDHLMVRTNLSKLGVSDLKNKCFNELSNGQQRRVLLARALCSMKKILILDEPTSGLDAKTTRELYALIDEMNREDNITIIMVSHDLRNVLSRGKHVLYLGNGENSFTTVQEYRKTWLGDYCD